MKTRELGRILLFCLGGVISVGIYYLILYTFTEYLKIWYPISATIGSVIMYSFSFLFQKFITFGNKETKAMKKEMALYFSMAISFLLANSILLYVLVEFVHLKYLIAQAILTIVLSIVSYVITKRILSR